MISLGVWLGALAGMAFPSPDRIDGPSASASTGDIVWQAPPECSTAHAIRIDVERLLDKGDATLVDVLARGTVSRSSDGGWSLDLRVVTPQGTSTRQLTSDRCETLAEAAALYIAMAVDPMALLEIEPPAEPPPPDPVTRPVPVDPPPPPTPSPTTSSRPSTGVGLRVAGLVGVGLLPRWNGGVALGVFLMRPWARFELHGGYGFATTVAAHVPEVRARLQHGYVELRACPHRGRVFQVSACVGLDAGGVQARGLGVRMPRTAREPWLAAITGFGAHWWMIPRVGLTVQADAISSLLRPRFTVDGVGEVLRIGPIAGRVTLGLDIRLNRM